MPNDPAEIEADQIADKVMRMPIKEPISATSRQDSSGAIQRKCRTCKNTDEDKDEKIQRKALPSSGTRASQNPAHVQNAVSDGGHALDRQARSFFEPRLGYDLSSVRIHTGSAAAESAHAIDAKAYTLGNDIVFGNGEYQSGTDSGKRLIAHELAHVTQQKASNRIHRKAADKTKTKAKPGSKPPSASKNSSAVVEDGQKVTAGQMNRSKFLDTLRSQLISECDIELARKGRSARNCPYIINTIEYYRKHSLSMLLRLIQVFAKPAAGATATDLISATVKRARNAARKIAAKGGEFPQAKTESGNTLELPHNPVSIRSKMGSGRMLDPPIKRQMENSFGTDFGSVRIHDDGAASSLSAELGAKAFTIGNDIAFSQGRFKPETKEGKRLLAHELAHTMQQNQNVQNGQGTPGTGELEKQADLAADSVTQNQKSVGNMVKTDSTGPRVSLDPVTDIVVAGLILSAEVGTEVVVADTAIVLVAESAPVVVAEAAPFVIAESAPVIVAEAAPLVMEAAPMVAEAAPLVSEAAPILASSPSAVSTLATAAAVTTSAVTLSSDSPRSSDVDQEMDEEQRRGRCTYMSVGQQFGRYPCHAAYATSFSGVSREVRVTTAEGLSVDYDAIDWSETLYEVKTGYRWLAFDTNSMRVNEVASRFWMQAAAQMEVAAECGHPLEWYFNDPYAASFFGAENAPYPQYFTAPMPVPVWYKPFDCNQDSDD